MICTPNDTCHCNSTITLKETVNAKLRQRHHWNTLAWRNRYKSRNQVETFFGLSKASYGTYDTPTAIRVRGLHARGAATIGIMAAMNVKLIAANRLRRDLPPHPNITGPPAKHGPPLKVAA